VVLESTTYPGTTEERLAPVLEEGSGLRAGADFHLGYSPERIDPGNQRYSLANTPKIAYAIRLRPVFETIVDPVLRFYHAAGSGEFNNADSQYLINAVDIGRNEVAVIRVKPPTIPADNSQNGSTEARYWSFNEGDQRTSTPFGANDTIFKTASDGFVYLAVGHRDLQREAERMGFNFMPWEVKTPKGVILYRNLVAADSFPGNINLVPPLSLTNQANIYLQDASRYIGDYAPTGVKMSAKVFRAIGGGIVPP